MKLEETKDWTNKVNPNPATAEEQIADLDEHYPGGFQAWYMASFDTEEETHETNNHRGSSRVDGSCISSDFPRSRN